MLFPFEGNLLITGGCGFIGSHFLRRVLPNLDSDQVVVNLDKLTYAGSLDNLKGLEPWMKEPGYRFFQEDICDLNLVLKIFKELKISCVVHFAAESHVDRSIIGPREFIDTNVIGTFNLLEASLGAFKEGHFHRFHQVSTDEVYGSLDKEGSFCEDSPYWPRSPYAASKASADHLVRAYQHTYGLPVSLSHSSNNYGPFQYPEKLIPVVIKAALQGNPIPVYGDGKNIRDWIHVEDHCDALVKIICTDQRDQTFNIGSRNELQNIELVIRICEILNRLVPEGTPYERLIEFVKDRPGHDRRYSIDPSKIEKNLNWNPKIPFQSGLEGTVEWYLGQFQAANLEV